jgi:hypothetical protein
MNNHDANAEINSIGIRDVLLNTNLGLTMLVAIFALMISIKTTLEAALAKPPGNVGVCITWAKQDNTDVDLWVSGPGEPRAIGYSRKSGKLFDLLRDDLGFGSDATDANFECAYTRGIVPGEHIANVHCYRCPVLPQVVNVEVTANTGDNSPMRTLVTTDVTLRKAGQEMTAIRFILEKDGTIRPGSMHAVFKAIRSAKP